MYLGYAFVLFFFNILAYTYEIFFLICFINLSTFCGEKCIPYVAMLYVHSDLQLHSFEYVFR
jgi:hypothetical protein